MIVNGFYTVAFVALAGGVVWRAWAVDVRERRSLRRVQRTVRLIRMYGRAGY